MVEKVQELLGISYLDAFMFCVGMFIIAFLLIVLVELRRLRKKGGGKEISRRDIDGRILNDEYRQIELLPQRHWEEYRKLRSITEPMGLLICPRVSVLALTEPREHYPNHEELRKRLEGQQIDFVVCNKAMKVQALIRLLDNRRIDGQAKIDDDYANAVLGTCNYKIIKTWTITPDILDFLK